MANIIDRSYFFGEIAIGQLSTDAVKDKLNIFIGKHEDDLLQGILGYASYKDFKANPTAPKWVDVRDGKEYVDENNVLCKWEGLIVNDGEIPESLIASYVYYWYQRSQLTNTGGVGEVKTDTENSSAASPKFKMVNAWNNMIKGVEALYSFMRANKTVYNDWYEWGSLNNSNVKYLTRINHLF